MRVLKTPQEVKFFTVDDGRTCELILDEDSGRGLITTQDLLLAPGAMARVNAPYTLLVPEGYILMPTPADPSAGVQVLPALIRGQRLGPFWLFNSADTAFALPAGTPVITFFMLADISFDLAEVTL